MGNAIDIRKNGGVEILKASAGSGKTFTLAREYIRLLLLEKDPSVKPHRHILAVTFTNKATAEMKSRIVGELDTLAHRTGESQYRDYLMTECGFKSDKELQKASDKVLKDILSDYGLFSVSTIDSFFQQTLRAFSREIGQFAEYRVELDRESLVAEAVDRVLDSLSEDNAELLHWLSSTSIEKIESGDGYRLESNLSNFAKGYLSASYQSKAESLNVDEQEAFSKDNILKLNKICRDIMKKYDSGLKKAAEELDSSMKSFAFWEDAFSSNFRSKVNSLVRYDGKKPDFSGSTWPAAVVDIGSAIKNKFVKKFSDSDIEMLQKKVADLEAFNGRALVIRTTASLLLGQIYVFRVADSLNEKFAALLDEKNVLSIDDTNTILRDIINNSDAPFIYEKTGVRYRHFLLDEFQDTSTIQWENFRPLLQNSIAEGCYNLVVGDVKQSIYRWRDADWKILGERIGNELGRTAVSPLDVNYRSAENIVGFNNAFYKSLASHIDVGDLYSDVEQQCAGHLPVAGCVDVKFCAQDKQNILVVDAVRSALGRGFRYKDIAVIVRTNDQGGSMASSLIAAGIPVVTNDSLLICGGKSVRDVVSGLFKLDDPEDLIDSSFAPEFDYSEVSKARSLTEMADALLRQLPVEQVNADTLYVLAFMDLMRDFASRNGNSLHGFLQYWKEDGILKNISSPGGSDAVTVITVHKSKGLSYPCVVLPLPNARSGNLGKCSDRSWEMPDIEDTPFEDCAPALYNVSLGTSTEQTLFASAYRREKALAYVDNANTWYVAMTRAEEEMDIIALTPSKKVMDSIPWSEFTSIGDALYLHILNDGAGFEPVMPDIAYGEEKLSGTEEKEFDRYLLGLPALKAERNQKPARRGVPLEYAPDGKVPDVRGKVRISNDAADFFSGEGEASPRHRGSVLHGIMEHIMAPEDLPAAIAEAVADGLLSEGEASAAETLLGGALASVKDRRWFGDPESEVRDERGIIDPSGEDQRPDRVIIRPDGSVEIIDYKFGSPRRHYASQVSGYMSLYRRMGYKNVKGYLWYVETSTIEQILL